MFFPNTAYRDRVLKVAELMILRHLGAEGELGMAAFIGVLTADVQSRRVNLLQMAKDWRRAGLFHDEAALALIDGVVSRMKEVGGRAPDVSAELSHMAGYLERVIDAEFDVNPGRVAPVNGRIGAALSEHLGDFLRPL